MPIRITLQAPTNPERISRIRIYRSLFREGQWSMVADLSAHDSHGNFIPAFEDPCANSSNYFRVSFVDLDGQETMTDPVRMCAATPVQIIYTIPKIPKEWQVDTVFVERSDAYDGTYDVISKALEKPLEYGPWKASFVDIGGSDSFFYRVTFSFSRWNDEECKSEFYTSPPSDPISPIKIDGKLVAKITVGHLSINDMHTSEEIPFRKYPNCGYHRYNPADVLKGNNASPYSRPLDMSVGDMCGGSNLFGGPMSIYDQTMQREQMLLETTAESVILLRRKWDGKQCYCMSKTEEHPINQCGSCFGTGFLQGYDRIYYNDGPDNPEGRILTRFYPAVDDLGLKKMAGLDVINQPNAWTLGQPIVRDRDILVQFDPIDTDREIWRYEVLDVTRNAFLRGVNGAQIMRLQRLNRLNDIAYSFPLSGTFETEVWDMQSNIHNSYGYNTGERSGERLSVDDDDEVSAVTMPTYEEMGTIMDAYSRRLWAFINLGTVPLEQMVIDNTGPLFPVLFMNLGDKVLMTQINSASTTINNYSVLRAARVEIESPQRKEYAIDMKSLNSNELLKTFIIQRGLASVTDYSTCTFEDTVKLLLTQTDKMKSIAILLIERK